MKDAQLKISVDINLTATTHLVFLYLYTRVQLTKHMCYGLRVLYFIFFFYFRFFSPYNTFRTISIGYYYYYHYWYADCARVIILYRSRVYRKTFVRRGEKNKK